MKIRKHTTLGLLGLNTLFALVSRGDDFDILVCRKNGVDKLDSTGRLREHLIDVPRDIWNLCVDGHSIFLALSGGTLKQFDVRGRELRSWPNVSPSEVLSSQNLVFVAEPGGFFSPGLVSVLDATRFAEVDSHGAMAILNEELYLVNARKAADICVFALDATFLRSASLDGNAIGRMFAVSDGLVVFQHVSASQRLSAKHLAPDLHCSSEWTLPFHQQSLLAAHRGQILCSREACSMCAQFETQGFYFRRE